MFLNKRDMIFKVCRLIVDLPSPALFYDSEQKTRIARRPDLTPEKPFSQEQVTEIRWGGMADDDCDGRSDLGALGEFSRQWFVGDGGANYLLASCPASVPREFLRLPCSLAAFSRLSDTRQTLAADRSPGVRSRVAPSGGS
jgi:hypothetical protein